MTGKLWPGMGVVLIWLLAGTSAAIALDPSKAITQYSLDHWGPREGLDQTVVQAIVQTPDGYLWLATRGGLVRFDGVRFTTFNATNTPEIGQSHIMALAVGKDGALWIGTAEGGLTRYRNGLLRRFTTQDGLSNNFIRALFTAADGTVWVGTYRGGLTRIDGDRATPAGLEQATVRTIYQSRDGRLWIGTDKGLYFRQDSHWICYAPHSPLAKVFVSAIREDRTGGLWVGTNGNSMFLCRNGAATQITERDGLLSRVVRTMLEDRDGNFWFGTAAGLNRWRGRRMERLTTPQGLPHSYVRILYEDREGGLWMGFFGGGLGRLKDGQVTTYTAREGLTNDYVSSVLRSRDGSVWVSGFDNGLDRIRNGNIFHYGPADGLPTDPIRGGAEAPDGSLWFGTRDGLLRWTGLRFKNYPLVGGQPNSMTRSVAADRQGKIWAAIDDGLSVVENGRFRPYRIGDSSLGAVWALLAARDGGLWIGGENGVGYLQSDRLHLVGGRLPRVWAMHEDSDGVLWLGTNNRGLIRIKKDRPVFYTTRDGLPDETIYQVLEDHRENLWMSSNRGIFRASKKELDDFADGRTHSIRCRTFGIAEGMAASECSGGFQPAGCVSRDGRLWFPTVKGLATIDPRRVDTNPLPPNVLVEETLVHGRRLPWSTHYRLPANERDFEFHYTALSLLAPERVLFRYRLEGFDRNWIDSDTRRTAFYTNLPAGNFRFRVQACNNDGVWNETGASVDLSLDRTFHESPQFYILPGLALALAGILTYRVRMRVLRARADRAALEKAYGELEGRVHERTAELEAANQALQAELGTRRRLESQLAQAQKLESLGRLAGGVAHDFNNLLTVINGYSEMLQRKLPPEDPRRRTAQEILKAGERAAVLTRQLLTFSRRIPLQPDVLDLNVVIKDLDRILRRMIGEHIEIILVLEPALGRIRADRGQIEQVVINLAVNARDAMPRGGSLSIRTSNIELDQAHADDHPETRPGPHILLEISDTGTGMDENTRAHIFEPFFTTKEVGKGTGLGLSAAYGIVRESAGHMTVLSKQGEGATFQIYFPRLAANWSPDSPPALYSANAQTILLAEDRPDVRSVTSEILTSRNYRVLEASNGKEALDIIARAQEPIHLLLTDVIMPGMTGRELADRLKPLRPEIRILFMSGYTDEVIAHLGALDRDVAYLQKPFTPDALIRKVREVLSNE